MASNSKKINKMNMVNEKISLISNDEDVLGLNIAIATERVRAKIAKWAQLKELEAVERENYEIAALYRDAMNRNELYVRRVALNGEFADFELVEMA
jgi:hypothetical protein